MTLPAEQETYLDDHEGSVIGEPLVAQMPINPTERALRARRGLNGYASNAADLLATTKQSAAKLYRQARERAQQARAQAAEGYARLTEKTGELASQTRSAARYARHAAPRPGPRRHRRRGPDHRCGNSHLEVEIAMINDVNSARSFASILADTKDELKQFAQTRITLLKAELSQNAKLLKVAAPLAIVGILLLVTAYFLFTFAVVGVVVALLPTNPWRWAIAFAAVGLLWTILGAIAAWFAKREFAMRELMPKKTIRVLKEDGIWIQHEVKNQI